MAAGDITQKLQGIGGYRLANLLGFNGMFATFQGEDPQTGDPVLIVAVHQSYVPGTEPWENFQREFNALLEMQSDYVCGPIAMGIEAAHYFAVYDWEQGGHLGVYVRDSGLPDVSLSYQWMGQVAKGLAAIDRKGISHRVINPASIFVTATGSAKLLHGAWGRMILGTENGLLNPAWASILPFSAPEIAAGQDGGDSADVYALGANLYFLLTGQPPFWHDDPQSLAYMIQHDQPTMDGVEELVGPDAFDVLAEMLSKDPAERPVNLPALGDRLISIGQHIVSGGYGVAREESPETQTNLPPITAPEADGYAGPETGAVPKFVTREQEESGGERKLPPKHRERTAPVEPGRGYNFEGQEGEAGYDENAYPPTSEQVHDQAGYEEQQQYAEPPPAGAYEQAAPALPPYPAVPPSAPIARTRGGNKKFIITVSIVALVLIVGSIFAATFIAGMIRGAGDKKEIVTQPKENVPKGPVIKPEERIRQYEENRTKLRGLSQWVKGYFRANGIWPKTFEELKALGAIDAELNDYWGTPMDLRDGFVVSAGLDKKWDTDDDAWWDAEKDIPGGHIPRRESSAPAGAAPPTPVPQAKP